MKKQQTNKCRTPKTTPCQLSQRGASLP